MSKGLYVRVVLLVVLSLGFSGCAAISISPAGYAPIGTGETIRGLQSVTQGAPGTFVYQFENTILMAWPKGSNYAFATLQADGKAVTEMVMINGRAISTYKLADLVKAMEASGWKSIPTSALPPLVIQALWGYSVEAVMAGSKTLPTIFVVPAIWMEDFEEKGEVIG